MLQEISDFWNLRVEICSSCGTPFLRKSAHSISESVRQTYLSKLCNQIHKELLPVCHALQIGGFMLSEKNGTFSGIGLANVFPAPRWGRHNFFLRWLVQTEVHKKTRVKKLISSWRSIHPKLKTFLKIGQNSFLAKDLLRISRFSLQTVCKENLEILIKSLARNKFWPILRNVFNFE